MKEQLPLSVEIGRIKKGAMGSTLDAGRNGAFRVVGGKRVFTVIASDQEGWDHVSVSLNHRDPTWAEMCKIKDLFFDPEEVVTQYHPAKSKYVNLHPHCLHLWRDQNNPVILPPIVMV